jgi:hypothetical protein
MLNNPAWGAFYLWKDGEVVAENAARCPKTLAALADVPLTRMSNRSPSILFRCCVRVREFPRTTASSIRG